MGLALGKQLDRSYNIRVPFLDGFYDIGVFFNKKSSFLLFRVDSDFPVRRDIDRTSKISMFKNLESSRFCETFMNLHSYRKNNLDIINQFQNVKPEYYTDVNFILNETLNLSKIEVDDKTLFDTLTLYGLCLTAYSNEFIFIIAERQNIIRKLNKKIVRTTGVQISTTPALTLLDEFHSESLIAGRMGLDEPIIIPSEEKEVIRLSDSED